MRSQSSWTWSSARDRKRSTLGVKLPNGWAHSQVYFGQGTRDGSINATVTRHGVKLDFLQVWSYGKVMLSFGSFMKAPFDDENIRREWLGRINAISGMNLPEDAVSRFRPSHSGELSDDTRLSALACSGGLACGEAWNNMTRGASPATAGRSA